MKGIAICLKGVENICAQELTELGAKVKVSDTAIEFDGDIAKICYRAQSVVKVLELLGKCKVSDDVNETLDAIEKLVKKVKLELNGTFKVRCKRIGKQNYSGQDIAPTAGEYVINKTAAKAAMEDPDKIVYIYIYEDQCYMGIDYSGFDLSKRDYKVFVHPSGLNSTIAYMLFRLAKSNAILDPFCGSGTIPIEAQLYLANKSPHFFKKDKFTMQKFIDINLSNYDNDLPRDGKVFASDGLLRFVKATRDNAKLAGVSIDVTRMDIDWMDTKMDEHAYDIVTHPPPVSKLHDAKSIEKLYKEFFYQANYVAKDKIIMIVEKNEMVKKTIENFEIQKEIPVMQGGKEMIVVVIKRRK